MTERFMLFVGSRHDEVTRKLVAAECRARGIEVLSDNGMFGTVSVRHRKDGHAELSALPGVTSAVMNPEGCPHGQDDCETERGGVCMCGMPGYVRDMDGLQGEAAIRAMQARTMRDQ